MNIVLQHPFLSIYVVGLLVTYIIGLFVSFEKTVYFTIEIILENIFTTLIVSIFWPITLLPIIFLGDIK